MPMQNYHLHCNWNMPMNDLFLDWLGSCSCPDIGLTRHCFETNVIFHRLIDDLVLCYDSHFCCRELLSALSFQKLLLQIIIALLFISPYFMPLALFLQHIFTFSRDFNFSTEYVLTLDQVGHIFTVFNLLTFFSLQHSRSLSCLVFSWIQ